jgi:17 kDa outer membrane surface antigen
MALDRSFPATLDFVLLGPLGHCRTVCATATKACSHCCQKRLHTNDVYHPCEIVGEDVQSHLGSKLWQAFHLKCVAPIRILSVPKWMLDRLAAHMHGMRVRIETVLHGSKQCRADPAVLRECLARLRRKTGSEVERTGPIASQTAWPGSERDLAAARAAVSEMLSRGGKTTSIPWENPRTARGTLTPLASAYTQDGVTCHDFLASYVRDGSTSWLQGEACRTQPGRWEVRKLTPWKKSNNADYISSPAASSGSN